MVCCVSYTSTASCVATAYTILYGNEKAGGGPLSVSPGLGEEVGLLDSARTDSECVSGGGSMNDGGCDVTAASGSGGIASA